MKRMKTLSVVFQLSCLLLFLQACKQQSTTHNQTIILQVDGKDFLSRMAASNSKDLFLFWSLEETDALFHADPEQKTSFIKIFGTVYSRHSKTPLRTVFPLSTLPANSNDAIVLKHLEIEYQKIVNQVAAKAEERLNMLGARGVKIQRFSRLGKIKIETSTAFNLEDVSFMLSNSGDFVFTEIFPNESSCNIIARIDSVANKRNIYSTVSFSDNRHSLTAQTNDKLSCHNSVLKTAYVSPERRIFFPVKYIPAIDHIFHHPVVYELFPSDIQWSWCEDYEHIVPASPEGAYAELILVYKCDLATEHGIRLRNISEVRPVASAGNREHQVNFTFDTENYEQWKQANEHMVKNKSRVAVVNGDVCIGTPHPAKELSGEQCSIDHLSKKNDAQLISYILKSGAYPCSVELVEETPGAGKK